MVKPEFSLFLGLLALVTLLSPIETRNYPHEYDAGSVIRVNYDLDDVGTVIGPHDDPDDPGDLIGPNYDLNDLGTIIGPHGGPDDPGTPRPDTDPEDLETGIGNISRRDFPLDFIFGTAVSAFQVEGAKQGSRRGLTIWDEFTHKFADKIMNNDDGDLAVDFYHHYKHDVKLMKDLKTNGFRFSISWTRLLPYGRESREHPVNEKGVKFYNDLIAELKANGIKPFVTLFHWESPLALEREYKGFLDKRMVEDFRAFAKLCFENFGGNVTNWATFNEPSVYSVAGYSQGKKAPGRCSHDIDNTCVKGDSSTEPYKVAHNQILAHLAAVDEFKKCKKCQEVGGKIGIVLGSNWFEPLDPKSQDDELSRRRSLEFQLGWFMHPLTQGDYPSIMKEIVKDRLPSFTEEESKRLRDNPLDFVGLNYYGAFFVTHNDKANLSPSSYGNDLRTKWTTRQKESPHLKATSMNTVIYPKGLRNLLKHIKVNYNDPDIYIMGNGLDELDSGTKPLDKALDDFGRKEFLKSHIMIIAKSIRLDNVKVKGYFIWSLLDNFEWQLGYNTRFGLYYVDYNDGLKRHMRGSGKWLKQFLSDESPIIDKCYFESHREKRHPPVLFPIELHHPDEYKREFMSSYVRDFM